MSYYDQEEKDWLELRAEALAYANQIKKNVITKWLNAIGYTKPVGYELIRHSRVIKIYTKDPGILIGVAGCHIDELKKIASDEYNDHREWKTEIIEIRDGFVNI